MKYRVRTLTLLANGRIPLIKRTRNQGEPFWVIPGGGVEHGETKIQALQREIREEIGIAIKDIELLYQDETIAQTFYISKEDTSKEKIPPFSGSEFTVDKNNTFELHELTIDEFKTVKINPNIVKEKFINLISK